MLSYSSPASAAGREESESEGLFSLSALKSQDFLYKGVKVFTVLPSVKKYNKRTISNDMFSLSGLFEILLK